MKKLISAGILAVLLVSVGPKLSYANDGCIVDMTVHAVGQVLEGVVQTAAAVISFPFVVLSGSPYATSPSYSYAGSSTQGSASGAPVKRSYPPKPTGVEFWTSDEYQG